MCTNDLRKAQSLKSAVTRPSLGQLMYTLLVISVVTQITVCLSFSIWSFHGEAYQSHSRTGTFCSSRSSRAKRRCTLMLYELRAIRRLESRQFLAVLFMVTKLTILQNGDV